MASNYLKRQGARALAACSSEPLALGMTKRDNSSTSSTLTATKVELSKKLPSKTRVQGQRFHSFQIVTGMLTEDEKDRIFELAEKEGKKAWTIARLLKRHPSTVSWFMYQAGLKELSPKRKPVFWRGGREIRSFSGEEDAFITSERLAGKTPAEIARMMQERYGYPRSRDTIASRLMMLASHEAATEAVV